MRVVILQPGYLPWLGFFDQMYKSDVFVIYDDVQYDKHGWRNRNRIKTAQGTQWLTVPILTKGKDRPLVKDVLINSKMEWRQTHLRSIKQNYSRAAFFDTYFEMFENIYAKEWKYLIDVDMAFIFALMEKLGLTRRIEFSSSLGISGDETQRLVDICLHFRATDYLTGDAAKDYLDEPLFSQNGIRLCYHDYQHPVYPQLYGEFIPYLSVVDLLFNHGGESLGLLTNKKLGER
jgi:hypothetical protein